MTNVKCKFVVTVNEEVTPGVVDGGHKVVLCPVVMGSKENEEFFKYTPGGEIRLEILNQAAHTQFEIGKEFYVIFQAAS